MTPSCWFRLVLLISAFLVCSGVRQTYYPTNSPIELGTASVQPKIKFDKLNATMKALLTVDGGGLRGVIAVEVLSVVESGIKKVLRENEQYGVSDVGDINVELADFFTAFSGVNCGAWIASYLASKCGGHTCKAVLDSRAIVDKYGAIKPGSIDGLKVFFNEYATQIFSTPNLEWMRPDSGFRLPFMNIPGLTYTQHPSAPYRQVLTRFLGNTDMESLPAILLLPTYDLIRRAVVLFCSGNFREAENITADAYTYIFETQTEPRDPAAYDMERTDRRVFLWRTTVRVYTNKKYSLVDLTQAAGSRVITHSAHRFTARNDESFEFLCQDSSLMANNPTLMALNFVGSTYYGLMTNVSLLSIGTGMIGGSMAFHKQSGSFQWMLQTQDFFSVVIHGGSELIQAQMDMFFYFVLREHSGIRYGQYLRVQTSADADTSIGEALATSDNARYLQSLTQIGKQTADTFRASIMDFVETFVFGIGIESREFRIPIKKGTV